MRPIDRNTMIFSAILMTLGTAMQVATAASRIGFNSSVLALVLSSAAIAALVPMLMMATAKAQMNRYKKSDKLFMWIPVFWGGSLPLGMLLGWIIGDAESGWLIFLTLCAWAAALPCSFLLINYLPQPNRGI